MLIPSLDYSQYYFSHHTANPHYYAEMSNHDIDPSLQHQPSPQGPVDPPVQMYYTGYDTGQSEQHGVHRQQFQQQQFGGQSSEQPFFSI